MRTVKEIRKPSKAFLLHPSDYPRDFTSTQVTRISSLILALKLSLCDINVDGGGA